MKLSTRARYGLRAVVELSASCESGPVSLSTISLKQNIPEAYLEQLMRILKGEGIVTTVRGKNGGYNLARGAEDITVYEILTALEGNASIVDCVGEDAGVCENACTCASRPLFMTLQNRIDSVLKQTTLQDLTQDYKEQKTRMQNAKSLSR